LLFIVTEYALQQDNPRLLWPLALLVALQWLAGFPQIAFYSLVANGVYLLGRLYCQPLYWRKRVGFLLLWGSAVVLGLLLAAPQWLPTYELAGFSIRAEGIQGSMVGEKSLFPAALLTFVLQSWRDFFAQAGLGAGEYLGILPILLALTAVFARPQRRLLYPLLALIIITIILALGRYNPAFFIVRQLPGFSSFRAPSRFLIPAMFGIITLFGLGWDTLFSSKQQQAEKWFGRFLKMAILLFLASSLVGYALLVRFQVQIMATAEAFTRRFILDDAYHLQSLNFYQAKIERLYALLLDATGWSQLAVFIPFLVVMVGFISWRMWRKEPTRFRYVPALWFALIILDILLFAGGWRATDSLSLVTQPPTAVQIIQKAQKPQELCRIFWLVDEASVNFRPENLALLPANYQLIFGLASTGVYSPLGLHHYYRLTEPVSNVNLAFGLRPFTPADVPAQKPLLNLLNVCYLLSRQPLSGFPKIGQAGEVGIYANEGVLPRAFVVDGVEVVSTNEQALNWVQTHLAELAETATEAEAMAVIESPLPEALMPTAAQSAQVQILSYAPLEIVINVITPGNVLLLLTDTDYPGWMATLDGRPVPIYRANAAFKAVLIPSGEHQIVFTYEPKTFITGISLAIVGLILLSLWVFWAHAFTMSGKHHLQRG
jgi:hypothetical protein